MAATAGYAVKLQLSISAVFTTIGQLRDFTGPTISRTTYDVTSKSSTGRAREFIPGLEDGGEVTFNIVFDPDNSTHVQLITEMRETATAGSWKILTDADDTITFSAWTTGFTLNSPLDGESSADLTLKVTGVSTFS